MSKISTSLYLSALLLFTFVTFTPVLNNEFVNWDDQYHLLDNPTVVSLTPSNIIRIFKSFVMEAYVPLPILTYAIEYHFFQFNPSVYHLNNLLLHLAIVVLIFHLAGRLGLSQEASFLAALIFAVHPMHVESVAWITERKGLLYSFFYLLSLIYYVGYLHNGKKRDYILSLCWGLLSMLSKSVACSLPLVLFLIDWFQRRAMTKKLFIEKIPYLLYVIPITLMTYQMHARIPGRSITETFLTFSWSLAFYFKKFFAPFILSPIYLLPKGQNLANVTYASSLLIVFVFIFLIYRFRRNRWFIFACLYFLISIFFLSIFILLTYDELYNNTVVADRYMYLSSLGICLWLGVSLSKNRFRLSLLVIMLILFGVKTYQQSNLWQDSLTLWNHTIKHYPQSAVAYNNRGNIYRESKEYDKAVNDYQKAIKIIPRHTNAHMNIGLLFAELNQNEKALLYYDKALLLNPDYAIAYINRGVLFAKIGMAEEALADYQKSIELKPLRVEGYFNRGNLYFRLKKYDLALENYNRAIEIKSDFTLAIDNRSKTLEALDR